MPTYELGISSSDAVEIAPDYDSQFEVKQIRSEHRTPTGKLRIYKWGDYYRASMKVMWMVDTAASLVNSWWETNTELLLFITSSTATEIHSVYIRNDESPFSKFMIPYDNYYEGEIELETY